MWEISDAGACYSGESGESIGQTGILEIGKNYLVSIEVSGMTKGKLSFDSFGLGENEITEDGVYQLSGVATIPDISITALDYAGLPFDGCIKYVYVIEAPVFNVLDCADQIVYTVPFENISAYKSFVQVTIPWDLPNGKYYVQIESDTVTFNSDCFEVGTHLCTLLLSWTNDDNGYNLDYETLELLNKLRVYGKLWNVRPSTDKETFEYSNGVEKIIYAKTNLNQDLTIKQLPAYLVASLGIGVNQDHFYIDGTEFTVPEDIETNWRKSSATTPVNVVVRKKNANLINRNCK